MTFVEVLVEVAGWVGALLILAAYVLVSAEKLTGRSPLFQWMNLLGATGFIVNGLWHGAIPSATLNIVWMAIAIFALWRIGRIRRAAEPPAP
jgi:hypothetical protein